MSFRLLLGLLLLAWSDLDPLELDARAAELLAPSPRAAQDVADRSSGRPSRAAEDAPSPGAVVDGRAPRRRWPPFWAALCLVWLAHASYSVASLGWYLGTR